MIYQERIKLEELGQLDACGVSGESLQGLERTGEELRTFLDDYLKHYPDSTGWPQWEKRKVNHILFSLLSHQTQDHCSFCDGHPMKAHMTAETIEHFQPKAGPHARPDLRLDWDNLFACCSGCQDAKLQKWDPLLLKPDEPGYSFGKYFSCEFTTGKIVPRRRAPKADRDRAEKTIELYDLNRCGDQRKDMFDHDPYYNPTLPRDKKSFRYWADAVEAARKV